MRVGGSYSSGSKGGNWSRGRAYGLMLVLAFGAALLGVLVLHKLRERRIFNLLLREKDRDLLSLHLLLQRERDHNKEMERKIEEMKAKIYSLRNQKMELDRRLLEMESTIDSLKDEQRTMETTLEEKQNEIKMLREKETEYGKENPHLRALTESLKQREAEIEDLKNQLESAAKLRSVNTNDPSNRLLSLMRTEVVEKKEGPERLLEKASIGDSTSEVKSSNFLKGKTSGSVHEVVRGTHRREMIGEQTQKQGDLENEGIKDGEIAGVKTSNDENQEKKTEDTQSKTVTGVDDKEYQIAKDGQREKLEDSRVTGIHYYGNRSKEKRWRYITKKRRSENGWRLVSENRKLGSNINSDNGVVNMRGRKFFRDDRHGIRARNEEVAINKQNMETDRDLIREPLQVQTVMNYSDTKLLNSQNPEKTEDLQDKLGLELKTKPNNLSDARNQIPDERKLEGQKANGIQQNINGMDIKEVEVDNKGKDGLENGVTEEDKTANQQEAERDATNGVSNEDMASVVEDDKEYNEEIDESDF